MVVVISHSSLIPSGRVGCFLRRREQVCYKMFPYIITFQNKLKGVMIQYIRKILGVIFYNSFYSLSVFLHSLALEVFVVIKISRFFLRDQISVEWLPIAINAFFFLQKLKRG